MDIILKTEKIEQTLKKSVCSPAASGGTHGKTNRQRVYNAHCIFMTDKISVMKREETYENKKKTLGTARA